MMGNPSNPEATRAHFGGVMSKAAEDEKLCREEFDAVYARMYPLSNDVDRRDPELVGAVREVKDGLWYMWREAWKRARALSSCFSKSRQW